MKLKIITYPNPLLRTKTEPVKFPLSPQVKRLAQDMLETVQAYNGIGLAAPQVGKSLRLIVINLEHLGLPPFALYNPDITSFSKIKDEMEEGCLSIPKVFGMVIRPNKIKFKAQDANGEQIVADCEGLLAKVIQHEIDHINGILITDKITRFTQGEEFFKKMEKKVK